MPVSISRVLAPLLVAGSVEYCYLNKRQCLTVDANKQCASGEETVQRAHKATASFNGAQI